MDSHHPPHPAVLSRMAWKARRIVPLAGAQPACGAALRLPLPSLDNHWLVAANGRIIEIAKKTPVNCQKHDLGDVALLPPAVNAHTHLQLSWLAGKTRWGAGFAAWLQSLLPLLLPATGRLFDDASQLAALDNACANLAQAGTCLVADVGGSLDGAVSAVYAALLQRGITPVLFCEWFGFAEAQGPWPQRCAAEIAGNPRLFAHCAPAGHALYSTSAQNLQKARDFCRQHGRVFSFHLAESPEESALLLDGAGPLATIYAGSVLPQGWQAPRMRPLAYARKLGLLAPGALAVHGAQLNSREVAEFAATGAALCLCPRSNYNLAVGEAPVPRFLQHEILLCLGTDGLTSNVDLDVRNEALYLRRRLDLPWRLLWRLATVNGCAALGMPFAGLAPGAPARFSIWPEADDV